MYATSHVFSMRTTHVYTTQRHKQQWREERDAHFQSGNTVIILSSCRFKMRILRFDKVLSCFKNTMSNLKKHLESPGGVKQKDYFFQGNSGNTAHPRVGLQTGWQMTTYFTDWKKQRNNGGAYTISSLISHAGMM